MSKADATEWLRKESAQAVHATRHSRANRFGSRGKVNGRLHDQNPALGAAPVSLINLPSYPIRSRCDNIAEIAQAGKVALSIIGSNLISITSVEGDAIVAKA